MKGGIASGVVYGSALQRISADYRLRNIGGSSAGAIAAVFAAAAEYRRQSSSGKDDASGFAEIGAINEELVDDGLERLFQPSNGFGALFAAALAASGGARWRRLRMAWVFAGRAEAFSVAIVITV
ncbi:MAG: hypothetical protein AAF360_15020, partial [Pseudomonadota bacterium]